MPADDAQSQRADTQLQSRAVPARRPAKRVRTDLPRLRNRGRRRRQHGRLGGDSAGLRRPHTALRAGESGHLPDAESVHRRVARRVLGDSELGRPVGADEARKAGRPAGGAPRSGAGAYGRLLHRRQGGHPARQPAGVRVAPHADREHHRGACALQQDHRLVGSGATRVFRAAGRLSRRFVRLWATGRCGFGSRWSGTSATSTSR
jgi:hypothetical protein